LPISAALQRIDPELVEAAVDLGAAPIYLFGQLRFASRLPMMIAFIVLMIMGTLLLVLIAEWIRRRGQRGIVR
jgi:ABC-type spermidine/putrescine transport system permease subunit II